MSQLTDRIRQEYKASDDIRDAGLKTPEEVIRFDDIPYGTDPKWQALDVYRPRAAEGQTLPVIVSVHGGAWVYGDKERYQYYCLSLAKRGFAVVNFSYRLAPEHRYPAAMGDTNAAFRWVLVHAGEYGLDASRVFAVGDSAGAHMLALYCCICSNPSYAARYGFTPPEGFRPTAVALNCGVYRMDADDWEDREPLMADLLPGGGTAEELDLISPLSHITGDFPPAFVMTANDDFLKAHTPLMAAKLMEADVPFVFRFYGGKDVSLGHVFHCDMRSETGSKCNDDECKFFRQFL